MNNGIGKAKERELTPEVVASLHSHEVMAVLFAEVGAQGRPEYASVVSRTKDGTVFVDSGSFSFDYDGKKCGSGIEIELLERLVPFLKCMRGDFATGLCSYGFCSCGDGHKRSAVLPVFALLH